MEHNSQQHDHHHMQHNEPKHNKHAGHHTGDFLKRFWICLVLTVPILLLSHMIQEWVGFTLRFPGDRIVLAALSAVVYFWGGWPFLSGAVREMRERAIGMMTLVALAISVAFFYSLAVAAGLEGMNFFWELATLIDIMLLGHWLEMKSVMAAGKALESLVALLPAMVHVVRDGKVTDMPLQDLKNGDTLLIKSGEKIAADGVVLSGSSYVNESMLTGESAPMPKKGDDKVIAGSLNGDGSLSIRTTGAGTDSYLQKVINLVQSAQSTKSNTQNLADRVARWLTLIAILAGIATFLYWYAAGEGLPFALERLVTVMVTACPHALGVAIPLVVAISTAQAAVNGLLIRNRTAFEAARKLDTVIFDKTGTLTKGSHEVQKVLSLVSEYTGNDLLQYAAAAQQHSGHYIAQGIIRRLRESGLDAWPSEDFRSTQGVGVFAAVKGRQVAVVGPNYFSQQGLPLPIIPDTVDRKAETVSFVLIDGQPAGLITMADSLRENAAAAIAGLKDMNIRSYLLTGDNEEVAASVATKLGMDGYMAGVLPHQKQERVRTLQAEGRVVAMTGDGVNDAPALAQADVGIAVGSGTDVAAETADMILVNSDPLDVVHLIAYGRATYNKMVQNVFWAVGYNVIAIPLAAGVLYPHFVLSPAMGAVLMSLSTVIVALNAQLLRRSFRKS